MIGIEEVENLTTYLMAALALTFGVMSRSISFFQMGPTFIKKKVTITWKFRFVDNNFRYKRFRQYKISGNLTTQPNALMIKRYVKTSIM